MFVDLAINPFGADIPSMVKLAVAAEERGYGAVWVADHFSGAVVGGAWSRDPFVCLGAIATATREIDIGVLVANMQNRHPAQLAAAVNSLQSIAPDRVRLGIGSGAAPGSRFAAEHDAIGTPLGTVTERRTMLRESIGALRAIWSGRATFEAESSAGFDGLVGVVDASSFPHLIVGASAWSTIEVALEHADGVNLRRTGELAELVARLRTVDRPAFEVSVLDGMDDVARDPDRIGEAVEMGLDRLVLGISVPHDPARLDAVDIGAISGRDHSP